MKTFSLLLMAALVLAACSTRPTYCGVSKGSDPNAPTTACDHVDFLGFPYNVNPGK